MSEHAEFERLLDEYATAQAQHWEHSRNFGQEEKRATLLAHHERVVQERDRWKNEAMLMAAHQGIDNYQRCLDALAERDAEIVRQFERIGELTETLRKTVERGAVVLAERDARIAELEPDAERGRWLIDQAEDYDGHACFPEVRYRNGLQDGFEAKTVREAIDAARKAKEEP